MLKSLKPWPVRALILASAAFGAAACNPPETRAHDPYSASGELIALSGGDAGPQNACIACHGLKGEGNGAGVPRIAGFGAGYLSRQMEFYAAGLRRNPDMQHLARRLSQQQRQDVAAYYAALPAPAIQQKATAPSRLYIEGDSSRGLTACAACHGANGEGQGEGNPPLAGQPASYLADQLRQWRQGERRGDPGNLMLVISQRLSPAEIEAVSAYASSLPGDRPRPSRPEASLPERRPDPTNDVSAPRPRGAE